MANRAPVPAAPIEVDMPRTQSGGSPQHLLLTLLGDYWYLQPAPLPSAAMVDLLGEFGVTEAGARAALARLARRGLLKLSRAGRHTSYALSERAASVLAEGRRHILSFGARDEPWPGRWTVAAFSIPENQRDLRHNLRTRLSWLGFAPLYDGLWISPHDRAAGATLALAELGIHTATVFHAQTAAESPVGGDPIRAWNLETIREAYLDLCRRYAPVRQKLREHQLDGSRALVARTAFMDAWRNFPNLDPELPAALLPARWPRAKARALFVELYDGLATLASARVVQIIARYDEQLAGLVRSHTTDVVT